ncbi:MAG: hypothetical protein SFV81_11800, partial [Pirellulaceae bacterium]|nr:hypothetical protein [Pirellulaceae bacterium]
MKSFQSSGPKWRTAFSTKLAKHRKRQLRRLRFEAMESRRLLATIVWDGEAGDDRWETAANWQGNVLPSAFDDVVIDVPGQSKSIFIESGHVTVQSIDSQERLIVRNSGDLTIAAAFSVGISTLAAGIEVAPGRTLRASGTNTQVTIQGSSLIDGANLRVDSAARLAIPGVTNYENTSPGTFNSWVVDGSGSLLDLQNITTITSSSSHIKQHSISASSGGRIDLHRVTTFVDSEAGNPDGRNFAILASGTGSLVDLSALTAILDRSPFGFGITGTSSLQADGGGQIVAPLLASLSATDLVMSSPISLPSLTTFTQATIAVNGINVVMPTLTSIDGI